MNELEEYWYSQLKPKENIPYYNVCLASKNLDFHSINQAIGQECAIEELSILEQITFELFRKRMGQILCDFRRASHPPIDLWDTQVYAEILDAKMVAEFFQIDFFEKLITSAINYYGSPRTVLVETNLCDVDNKGNIRSNCAEQIKLYNQDFEIHMTMDEDSIHVENVRRKLKGI